MKFIQGLADTDGYGKIDVVTPELEHKMVGPVGDYGACCAEMDIYEANSKASSFTAHPCSFAGTQRCKGEQECGSKAKGFKSDCDKNGCGMNSFQLGDHDFFGEGKEVDSTRPVTLVTQFLTADGTDQGELVEIRRIFIQDGRTIQHTAARLVPGQPDSITNTMCDDMAVAFNESAEYNFAQTGGLKSMGEALDRGMVLVMSIWDDSLTRMLWLDAEKTAINKDPAFPGVTRGPCPFTSGVSKVLHEEAKASSVTFTDVKFGPIGSTQEAELQKKFVIDDAVTAVKPLSRGMTSAIAAVGVSLGFIAALALVVVVRTRQLRRLSPAPQAQDEENDSVE